MALVVGDVEVGDVQQWGLGYQQAAAVAVDRDQGDFREAVVAGFAELDDLLAEGVEVVAAGVDHPHLFDLFLAEFVEGADVVVVDSDL